MSRRAKPKRKTQKQRVRDFLSRSDEDLTPSQIARKLKLPAPTVRRLLGELARTGKAVKRGDGTYQERRLTLSDAADVLGELCGRDVYDVAYAERAEHERIKGVGITQPEELLGHWGFQRALSEWQGSDAFDHAVKHRQAVHVTITCLDPESGIIDGIPLSFALTGEISISQAQGALEGYGDRYKDSVIVSFEISFFDSLPTISHPIGG